MALTITIEGKGVIANADATTNDTGGDGTGDWGFTGSGGVANGLTTDTYLYGNSSISMALSGAKNGWLWFNTGTGTGYPLDFTPSTGSEAGQHIYIWAHCPTLGLMATLANVGFGVRIGSSTTNYRTFTFGGTNGSNGWNGGWKCFVIDPTKTGSIADGGTFDISSVQYYGIRAESTATAKGDNVFISQIAVGSGLRITGTSTTAWKDTVDYCTDYANRAWGMMQKREGIYYQYGMINIGDASSQSANVSFTDSGRIIQAGVSEYYISAAWSTSADVDYMGINIEDHTSYTTTFTDGVIVGSDNGRSGSTIIGNVLHNYSMDLYGGNHADSVTALYGTTLKDITGAINAGNDTGHKFLGAAFIGCAQFDPVGAPVIRNCTLAETISTDGSILWNSNIDIQDCSFIANTTGEAIEHDTWNGTASGTASNSGSETTVLTDTGTSFLSDVAVNDIVYNETDDSYATVTAVDTDTQVTHTALANGTNNYWTTNDAYSFATPISYTNLIFSGNTVDVNNTTAPANVVAISKAGTSNPTTESGFTVIQGSVTVKVTVKDKIGTLINDVQTAVYQTSDRTELMNEDTVSGVAETTFAGATPVEVEVRCRKASSGSTKYKNFSSIQTVQSGTGLDLAVTLIEDTINNATS